MPILIASHNQAKLDELTMILAKDGINASAAPAVASLPPEGTSSYLANARVKAITLSRYLSNQYVLADDSGLTLLACPGHLGVQTARELAKRGGDRLQTVLKMVDGADRTFIMDSWVSLAKNGQELVHGHGQLTGQIAFNPLGKDGRGFDRLLIPAGQTKPLALMDTATWLKFAHRARAVENLLKQAKEKGIEDLFENPIVG